MFWHQPYLVTTTPTGFLRFKKKRRYSGNQLFFWMFLHHPSKFGKFSLKICGEIIWQSWLLLTQFFNFCIVHCDEFDATKNQERTLHPQLQNRGGGFCLCSCIWGGAAAKKDESAAAADCSSSSCFKLQFQLLQRLPTAWNCISSCRCNGRTGSLEVQQTAVAAVVDVVQLFWGWSCRATAAWEVQQPLSAASCSTDVDQSQSDQGPIDDVDQLQFDQEPITDVDQLQPLPIVGKIYLIRRIDAFSGWQVYW